MTNITRAIKVCNCDNFCYIVLVDDSVYHNIKSGVRNDVEFNKEILDYLKFDVEK
jgi:hypothetical protein